MERKIISELTSAPMSDIEKEILDKELSTRHKNPFKASQILRDNLDADEVTLSIPNGNFPYVASIAEPNVNRIRNMLLETVKAKYAENKVTNADHKIVGKVGELELSRPIFGTSEEESQALLGMGLDFIDFDTLTKEIELDEMGLPELAYTSEIVAPEETQIVNFNISLETLYLFIVSCESLTIVESCKYTNDLLCTAKSNKALVRLNLNHFDRESCYILLHNFNYKIYINEEVWKQLVEKLSYVLPKAPPKYTDSEYEDSRVTPVELRDKKFWEVDYMGKLFDSFLERVVSLSFFDTYVFPFYAPDITDSDLLELIKENTEKSMIKENRVHLRITE